MSDGAAAAATRTATRVFDELSTRRFVLVSGKGGVGRTTVAALCGLQLAQRGARVLVATTGHDDRLAWMLGGSALTEAPTRVAPGLSVQRLTAPACIREYGALVLRSARVSSVVFDNRVVAKLMRAIPGLDDFSLIGKAWHDAFRGGHFDVVVFDGPATGHLLYTLGVPRAILSTIAAGPLTREAELMQAHLEDPATTAAVLVGLPERWPLTELDELALALRARAGVDVAAVFVNGLWPTHGPQGLQAAAVAGGGAAAVAARVRAMLEVGRRQREELAAWREGATMPARSLMLELPWLFEGVGDVAALDALARLGTDLAYGVAAAPPEVVA